MSASRHTARDRVSSSRRECRLGVRHGLQRAICGHAPVRACYEYYSGRCASTATRSIVDAARGMCCQCSGAPGIQPAAKPDAPQCRVRDGWNLCLCHDGIHSARVSRRNFINLLSLLTLWHAALVVLQRWQPQCGTYEYAPHSGAICSYSLQRDDHRLPCARTPFDATAPWRGGLVTPPLPAAAVRTSVCRP